MNVAYEIGKQQTATPEAGPGAERAQSRRMLVALVLLMVAIAVVAFRDRDFLFEPEPIAQVAPTLQTKSQEVQPATLQTAPSTPIGEQDVAGPSDITTPSAVAKQATSAKTKPLVQKQEVSSKASTPAKHISKPTQTAAMVTSQAAQRARVSQVTVVQEPSPALYPRLDKKTKVEGSVELQALVGTDGAIRELRVLRGPAVLGSAAREAVLQWKFKPYTQNGVPVETYAKVTVNFTIRVEDGSPKKVASVEPEHVIVLADNYQR